MNEIEAQARLVTLLKADSMRMAILRAVAQLQLHDGYVAAGFLRNLAWDDCHGFLAGHQDSTPLNDVDVIYFDTCYRHDKQWQDLFKAHEDQLKQKLWQSFSNVYWDIKNQARMHLKHQHSPYKDACDAMSYWPEKETAVGVRLTVKGEFEFVAPFGLARLFRCCISHNPKQEKTLFEKRVQNKRWLDMWPKLRKH